MKTCFDFTYVKQISPRTESELETDSKFWFITTVFGGHYESMNTSYARFWYVLVSLRRAVSGQLHRVRPPMFPAQQSVVFAAVYPAT